MEEVLKNANENFSSRKVLAKVTSKPKLFTCDLCNWQTMFESGLKTHKTRIHGHQQVKSQFKCDTCDFTGSSDGNLNEHLVIHTNKKRSKLTIKCEVVNCQSTFDTENLGG